MSQIEIPDWVVEVAADAYVRSRGVYEGEIPLDHDDIREALRAALEGWFEHMHIEWSHVREEKVYLPGNSLVAASRHAANLPPLEAEYRHIWQAKLLASTKNDELPPQDLYRITIRKEPAA